jgi:cytochrome c-type biogenesis protein
MDQISLPLAFLAGIVSFLSPCVLPLVPSYVSFISGVSFEDLTSGFVGMPFSAGWLGILFYIFVNAKKQARIERKIEDIESLLARKE